jgi:hypothetical protein
MEGICVVYPQDLRIAEGVASTVMGIVIRVDDHDIGLIRADMDDIFSSTHVVGGVPDPHNFMVIQPSILEGERGPVKGFETVANLSAQDLKQIDLQLGNEALS